MFTNARALSMTCGGILILAALPASARAGDLTLDLSRPDDPPAATSAPKLDTAPGKFTLSLSGRAEYQFESDLDKGDGSVSIARAGGSATFGIPIGSNSQLSIIWDSEFSWYDWNDASAFSHSAKDPWENTADHTLGLQLFVPGGDQWSWFVGGGVRASYELDASLSDSLTYAGQGGVRYKFNEAFALSGGLAVRTRLEEDAQILPIIGFDWKINEKLTLATQRGTGLQLRYQASDAIALTLEGVYVSREFRLSDDGAVKDGIGADRRVPVTAGIIWTIAPTVSVNAKGGVVAWSHYKLSDEDGVRIDDTDGDAAGFVEFSVNFRF